jgi:multicomponent K+:H+ antiporter subunit E
MMRFLPFPLLSLLLLAMWLLLNQSVSPGQILLGAVLAVIGGWLLRAVQAPKQSVRNPLAVIRLLLVVLRDIVRSNIAVGRIVLSPRRREIRSGFINIPLDIRNPYGLSILACIITATPGTLWVNFNSSNHVLLIHVLDFVDEQTWIDTIKGRYERLLLETFG